MRLVGIGLGLIGIAGALKSPVPASIASASQPEILIGVRSQSVGGDEIETGGRGDRETGRRG
ncbi:MAG TPA: hypothetical protein V6C85_08460, partial [Allocoleopsis sp.]